MKLGDADTQPAWCPGCGNVAILKAFDEAMEEVNLDPCQVVLVSGIGQAAKLPHYVKQPVNVFNGLHGRALAAAAGIKMANPNLNVIVTSGDGDMYGEGGNHFLHNIRRNIGVTCFVHNNQVYGLTKGQASPTSDPGFKTGIQRHGVIPAAFNPLAVAIVHEASFVARSFSGTPDHLREMMVAALRQEGFALLDILQPCVSFNRQNSFKWYRDHVRPIGSEHDPADRMKALELAFQWEEQIPIGVLYCGTRTPFEQAHPVLQSSV